jgi:multidrug resistance efflux pump
MPSYNIQENSEELISEEVKEIISYRPHWMIRKGNMVFFLVLLSLVTLTWFISYPDIINGKARLVSLNAPKMIQSKTEGKLLKLFVINEDYVAEGKHLGVMESTTSYNQILKLQQWINEAIESTETKNYEILVNKPLPMLFDLGEVQSKYQDFQNQLIETKQLLASGYYRKKKAALEKDLHYFSSLKTNTFEQKNLLEQDKQLQQKEYEVYERLEKQKVIGSLELNQHKSKLISKEQGLKQINSELTNTDIAIHGKAKDLIDLEKSVLDQQQKFHSTLLDLKSVIEKWIQQYVLIAPEDGKVNFVSFLQENELINNGQNLFYIESKGTNYYAEMMTGQKGIGKIDTGQKVILNVEGYPNKEYGNLKGKIQYISHLPHKSDSFLIKLALPQGLKTNYGKEIIFRNNLSAHAEIITDNRRLIDRFLGQLKQLLEK